MIEDAHSHQTEPEPGFADRLEHDLVRRLAAGQPQRVATALDRDEMRPAVELVDLDAARRVRAGRRRWPIAVAAVFAAVLLVAGTVVAMPSRRSAPADPALDTVLPPEGATPSTPETGEVVAGIVFRLGAGPVGNALGDSGITLYADGRLLFPSAWNNPNDRWTAEQRLTPEGVELVRSAFLSTGLFDTEQTSRDVELSCGCFARVLDDNGRLVVPTEPYSPPTAAERVMIDPRVSGEVGRLVEFMTHLESSLPATAWADRDIKVYVPSRYQASVSIIGVQDRPVRDLSKVLAHVLPPRLARHLDEQNWQHTAFGDSVVLTTADARALHQALTKALIGFTNEGSSLAYQPFQYRWYSHGRFSDALRQQRAAQFDATRIVLQQLGPDGEGYDGP